MFYAADHNYDVNISNDYASLYRFTTKRERDEFVSDRNFEESASGNLKTESVTRNEARRHFPNAFRMVGDFHDVSDERDWHTDKSDIEFWSAGNINEW